MASVGTGMERTMHALELAAAGLLLVLFAIGVYDFGRRILSLALAGQLGTARAVVDLLDTALLLFIVVEVFLTVIAYSRQQKVTRIVIGTGLIAITRKIITFHVGAYASPRRALVAAGAYGLLILVLVAGWHAVRDSAAETELV